MGSLKAKGYENMFMVGCWDKLKKKVESVVLFRYLTIDPLSQYHGTAIGASLAFPKVCSLKMLLKIWNMTVAMRDMYNLAYLFEITSFTSCTAWKGFYS